MMTLTIGIDNVIAAAPVQKHSFLEGAMSNHGLFFHYVFAFIFTGFAFFYAYAPYS